MNKEELRQEIESRTEALWLGLGVKSKVIEILRREYALSLEQAEGILRQARHRLRYTNEIGPSEIKEA